MMFTRQERGFVMARLDGRVKQKDRDTIITAFQKSDTIDVCLLSTGVGSVGLTLTNADRVVIYDPSWNPGSDAQAIDRAYRIGQTKPVLVYRLITCSTVEEKIFIRQVFKNSVIKQMVQSEHDPTRYFASQDIRELLRFDDPHTCKTYLQIHEMHGHQQQPCPMTDSHREEVRLLPHCFNVSDHDLLFSVASEEIVLDDDAEKDVRSHVVQTRQQLDSETNGIRMNQAGRFARPFEGRVAERETRVTSLETSPLANPTPIDEDIEVEVINESDVFGATTATIDESDLRVMSPLYERAVRSGDDDAVDLHSLSSDSDRSADALDESEDDESEGEENDILAVNSPSSPAAPRNAASTANQSSATSPRISEQLSRRFEENIADDSEVITGVAKKRLRVIDSDSERSSRNSSPSASAHCDNDGNDDSCATSHMSAESPILFAKQAADTSVRDHSLAGSNERNQSNVNLVPDDALSNDSRTSSECLDTASPANFTLLSSKFHSTAMNFDPMESPVMTGKTSHVFSAASTPQRRPEKSDDATVIISDDSVSDDDDECSSPVVGNSSSGRADVSDNLGNELSQRLSFLSIPKFDRTNHALEARAQVKNLVEDSPPDSSDEPSSPVLDDSGRDFHLRPSLVKSPTPSRMDFSLSRIIHSDDKLSDDNMQAVDDASVAERPESPLRAADMENRTHSATPLSPGSPPYHSALMSNVTVRRTRPKSRLVTNRLPAVAAALNFGDDVSPDDLSAPAL